MAPKALSPRPTEADIQAAEATTAALSAQQAGVPGAAITVAFGEEACRLARLAESLVVGNLPPPPAPDPRFVQGLEEQVVAAFDRRGRPVRRRRDLGVRRVSPLAELALATAVAAMIAIGAFLAGAGSLLNGHPTAVPTASAATETATAATPQVEVTLAPAQAHPSSQGQEEPWWPGPPGGQPAIPQATPQAAGPEPSLAPTLSPTARPAGAYRAEPRV